jgi:hypothetical protein
MVADCQVWSTRQAQRSEEKLPNSSIPTLLCRAHVSADARCHPQHTFSALNSIRFWVQVMSGDSPCLGSRGPRGSCGQPLRGPLQPFDGIFRHPFGLIAVTTDDDAGVQVRAAAAVEDPPAPSQPTNAGIFANLYAKATCFHVSDI